MHDMGRTTIAARGHEIYYLTVAQEKLRFAILRTSRQVARLGIIVYFGLEKQCPDGMATKEYSADAQTLNQVRWHAGPISSLTTLETHECFVPSGSGSVEKFLIPCGSCSHV